MDKLCYNIVMDKNQEKTAARKKAVKEFMIGLAAAATGAGISFASYNSARPGGTYTVYTGMIALGVIYACKGLFGIIFPSGLKKSKEATKPAIIEQDEVADEKVES